MTPTKTDAPRPAKADRARITKVRRRRRRARRTKRLAAIVAATVLMMALLALGTWVLFSRFPDATIRNYPMEYVAEIRAAARENDLTPGYVAAVILAESSYRPEAVSSADAQGLMQLLPSTAQWIAGKLGEEYVEGCLFDPETNIRYGCWYLGFLMRRYSGDMRCASAAYHAGQGTVDQWLQNPEYAPDGVTLAVIPYDTTNTYVQRVLKYYEKYAELYAT